MSLTSRWITRTERGVDFNVAKFVFEAALALTLLICLYVFNPFQSVPTGSRGVITQFGKIVAIAPEGLAIIPPWRKLAIFNVRAAQADIENADGSTRDTQPVKVSMTVRYAINPTQVAHVYEQYSHDGNLSNYIQTATEEVFKAVTAKYTATDLIAKRALVSADINAALKKKTAPYGAIILNIDMRNFSLSDSYMKAINEKVTQEQLRMAADNKVLTVEAEQRSNVAVAAAAAEIVRKKADGDAYAVTAAAKAQAEAITMQGQALRNNPDIIELRKVEVSLKIAQRWGGVLPSTVYGSSYIPHIDLGVNTGK